MNASPVQQCGKAEQFDALVRKFIRDRRLSFAACIRTGSAPSSLTGRLSEESSMQNRRVLMASVTVIAFALTLAVSTQSSHAREYHSRLQALHHLQHGPQGHSYGYATEYAEPSASPMRNWYGPGEYDRLMNGSDASTPGHN
jgi:hypothetical protein